MSADDSSMTQQMLTHAGYRSDNAVKIYYGIRIVSTAVMAFLGLTFRNSISANASMHIVFPAAMALGGFILPNFMLEKKIKKRLDDSAAGAAGRSGPDGDRGGSRAGTGSGHPVRGTELRNAHKELTEEFMLVNLEIRAGKRRGDALKNLGERAGEPELRKLMAILIQNDRFGTSVAESLRQHSDHLRVRRRQEAEERAAKVGVKLVFPIFFFILPAMMLVCAGPGVLGVVKYLLPLMKGF